MTKKTAIIGLFFDSLKSYSYNSKEPFLQSFEHHIKDICVQEHQNRMTGI